MAWYSVCWTWKREQMLDRQECIRFEPRTSRWNTRLVRERFKFSITFWASWACLSFQGKSVCLSVKLHLHEGRDLVTHNREDRRRKSPSTGDSITGDLDMSPHFDLLRHHLPRSDKLSAKMRKLLKNLNCINDEFSSFRWTSTCFRSDLIKKWQLWREAIHISFCHGQKLKQQKLFSKYFT